MKLLALAVTLDRRRRARRRAFLRVYGRRLLAHAFVLARGGPKLVALALLLDRRRPR